MSGAELLCLNLNETRRRSIRIWRAIPLSLSDWRPDPDAMSCFEMMRHVLEADYLYGQILRDRRSYSFLQLSDDDLNTSSIDRRDVGYIRKAGDFILRIAYHEAVHAGQMLQYLRMAGVPRPSVWD
jgi:hypothetical protein